MSERDYLERTIATVRNHSDAENCWPQWANIFADEIERLWGIEEQLEALRIDLAISRDQEIVALAAASEVREQLASKQAQWEEDMRAALRLRERLDQAEEFIAHQDMTYRWLEWLGEEDADESSPASRAEA